MRTGRFVAIVVAIVIVTALARPGVARAATVLFTPVISATELLVCRIVNVGAKTISLNMEIWSVGGNFVEGFALDLGPRQAFSIQNVLTTGYGKFFGNFSKSGVRGSVESFEDGRSILVVPAQ